MSGNLFNDSRIYKHRETEIEAERDRERVNKSVT